MNYDTVIFRRKTILFFVFSFCILLFCSNDAVAKPEIDVNMEKAAEILNSAFRKVYDLDVIGTVANPVICSPVRESMSIPGIVPEFSKFRVYRKKKKDGCFDLRVEMMVKDSLFAVAIQNADGFFLQNGNESAAFRCLDIPTVHCMEHPYLTIQPNELKYSHYDIQDAYFLGEQCWKITMSVPENLDDLRQNFVFGYSSYNEDEHALTRPFIRTYIIGKKTNVIYSKKSYNQNGELIYSFEYSAIDFPLREEDCRSLFKTPSDIYGMAESEELGFEQLYTLKFQGDLKQIENSGIYRFFMKCCQFLTESLTQQICLLVGIGVILVGTGVWIRMKRK